jgi:8-oxo-dGTP pyrophosphatase MutT (NUDIX family)
MDDYEVIHKGKFSEIITPDFAPTYEILHEGDIVHVIPILPDGRIGIRYEWIPPYLLKDNTGKEKYYTVISGHIDEGETCRETAVRELFEEAGVQIHKGVVVDLFKKLPVCKSTDMRVSLFIFDIQDYEIKTPGGDGTEAEERSATVWVTFDEFTGIFKHRNVDLLLFSAYNVVRLYNIYKAEK